MDNKILKFDPVMYLKSIIQDLKHIIMKCMIALNFLTVLSNGLARPGKHMENIALSDHAILTLQHFPGLW